MIHEWRYMMPTESNLARVRLDRGPMEDIREHQVEFPALVVRSNMVLRLESWRNVGVLSVFGPRCSRGRGNRVSSFDVSRRTYRQRSRGSSYSPESHPLSVKQFFNV